MNAPKSWNFWTRVNGLLYGIRAYHPDDYLLLLQQQHRPNPIPITPRIIYAYGGKSIQRWPTRLIQHLWGGGRYNSVAQPWADTVLGWRQDGTVEEVMAAGGAFIIWQGRTSPLLLSWREIVLAIKLRRPYYNYQWNRCRRRIPKYTAESQRQIRDAARGVRSDVLPRGRRPSRHQSSGQLPLEGVVTQSLILPSSMGMRVATGRAWLSYLRRYMVLAVLGVVGLMCIPGWPVYNAGIWVTDHGPELLGAVLVAGVVAFVGLKPKKRRRRRRR